MTAVDAQPRAYFADHARGWGAGVVASCLEARGRNDNARSVKSSIEEATGSYGGRFFVELLQNAHDAHPPGSTGGKVLMLLDETEGPYGTVYAADAGTGFAEENFRAISNLALSNKPVGEGIGNKGVGFKSVLQVCGAPEIYSRDPHDPARDGFCFGFADDDQLRELTADGDEFDWVIDNVSRYTVPVPIAVVPPTVRDLRDGGYSTVLRLPLRSAVAAEEADRRFEELGAGSVPVTLFLTRIDRLELRRRTKEGTDDRVLERHTDPLPLPGDEAPAAELVTVEQGRTFLLLTRAVDRTALMDALRESVSRERLKAKWLSWDAPAHVAVAVPYGWDDADDWRLYTYLPMGEDAHSPLLGHLHAPFFTDYARKGLEWDHPLNAMLVDAAASLAVDGAAALLASGEADEDAQRSAVDLVSWLPERSSHLPPTAQERAALPGLDGRPVPMTRARLWPDEAWDVLTAELAQRTAGLDVMAAELGVDRVERLRATLAARGLMLDLTAAELAAAVEAMAGQCHADGLPPSQWDLLYDDLAVMFDDTAMAAELAGRRLLLADDGALRRCAAPADASSVPEEGRTKRKGGTASRRTRRATAEAAFFQPVRQRTEDEDEVDPDVELDLPDSLRGRLFFLHPELSWHDENRQPNRARDLLMDNRLVRKFDARSLAEHVRAVLAATAAQRTHRDGLRFLYNLQRSRPSTALPLAETNVRLPAADGGTVPASEALFSRHWPDTRGTDLEVVASAPADIAPELAALRRRLLAAPDALLRPTDDRAAWTGFLRRLGVQDLLPVHRVRDTRALFGQQLCRPALAAAPGVPSHVAEAWAAALPAWSGAYATQTEYKTKGHIAWLPGQAEFDLLPGPVQTAYARLLLAGLEAWPDEHLSTEWERDRQGNKDPQHVKTPLSAFVACSRWLPVHDPSDRRETPALVGEAWHFRGGTDTEPPRFAPVVSRTFRAQIDAAPATTRRLRAAGMGVWNDRADAERLADHLAELLRLGRIDAAFLPHLANAYRVAWGAALEGPAGPNRDGRSLIVRMGSDLVAVPLTDAAESGPVVVTDDADDGFHRRVAADFGLPVLHLDGKADDVRDRLDTWVPGSAVRPETLGIRVQLDGTELAPESERPVLAQTLPWLRPLVGIVLAHRLPAQERPGDAGLRQALDILGRIRVAVGSRIDVQIGDAVRPAPARLRGVMALSDAHYPTLAVEAAHGGALDWDHLEALAGPLLQLIGYPRTETELRLRLAKLRRSGAEPNDQIDWAELAEACDIDQEDAAHTLSRLGGDTEETVRLARLIVAHMWGDPAARHLDAADGAATDEQLSQAVLAAASAGGAPSELGLRLLAAVRDTPTLDAVRRAMNIPLADMNATLAGQHPPQPLIDYGDEHAEAFLLVVLSHAPELHDRLRWARLDLYLATEPVPDWPALRDLLALRPDPSWATTLDRLDDQTALNEAERQLAAMLGAPLPHTGPTMEPMAALRARNRPVAEEALRDAAPAVRAWCRKNDATLPTALADPTDIRPAVALLDDAGVLDFAPLTKEAVLKWLGAVGAWPAGMHPTDDAGQLGLSPQDLAAEQSEEAQARQRRQKERRTIYVDGTDVDVGNGLSELRERILASLADNPGFLHAPARNTRLGAPPATSGHAGGGARSGAGGSPADRASDQQLTAIGFAGELLAYQWLLERYPAQVTEACWKSRNRAEAFAGDPGRDDLGYDFAVPFRGGTVMYEVKATIGDGGEFQLGESEVRTAQENLRNNNWRSLIVTDALTPRRRIRQLRNPFHPKSRGEYTFAGKGLRLLYRAD